MSVALVLSLTTALVAVPVDAAPESAPATSEAPDDLAEAQQLYEEGRAAYETFNYDAAINLWTTALARTPKTAEAGSVRNALVYNLAAAQLKAFALDHDDVRLKRARLLLERYLEEEQRGGSADPSDVARVEAQMAEIDVELAKRNAPPPLARTSTAPVVDTPPEKPARRRGTVMIGVGAALLVLSAGLGGGMATGIVISRRSESRLGELDTIDRETERPRVVERGELGNRVAIATGVVAGVALASGIALVVVGKRSRDRERLAAGNAPRTITRIGPMIAPGIFGIGAQVRL